MSSSAVAVSEFSNPNLEPLFTAEQIQTRVAEMGAEIARDYAGRTPLLIGVLKGAYIFLSDLVRAIDLRLGVEFMAISSYGAQMRSSGEVRILKDLDVAVEGRDILVVELASAAGRVLRRGCAGPSPTSAVRSSRACSPPGRRR